MCKQFQTLNPKPPNRARAPNPKGLLRANNKKDSRAELQTLKKLLQANEETSREKSSQL
jgi:hypothetical protein